MSIAGTADSSPALYVTSSGKTGIGVLQPDALLHLKGRNATGVRTKIKLQDDASSNVSVIGVDNNSMNVDLTSGDIVFGLSGSVGLNVASPTHMLTLPYEPSNNGGAVKAVKYAVYSSRRYKENVVEIDNALEKVNKMRGVYFRWKNSDKNDIGFIAEEVGEIITEVVDWEPNGIDADTLNYPNLTALLAQSVKEQHKYVLSLEERVAELELSVWKKIARWVKNIFKKST